jgi:hypothetical protein
MRMRELTPTQLSSVPCPTCGVAAGQHCLLRSGAARPESHVDRKLATAESIETKRYRRTLSREAKYRQAQSLSKRGKGGTPTT